MARMSHERPLSPAPSPSSRPAWRGVVLFADDEETIRWLGRRFVEPTGGSPWRPAMAKRRSRKLRPTRSADPGLVTETRGALVEREWALLDPNQRPTDSEVPTKCHAVFIEGHHQRAWHKAMF